MPTHTMRVQADYDNGAARYSRTETATKTGGSYTYLSESIPDGSTDLQVTFACDISQLKLFQMTADGTIMVETNNGTTPTDVYNLTSTTGVIWHEGQAGGEDVQSKPISADITTDIFVTNSSGAAVTLEIHSLEDPTP